MSTNLAEIYIAQQQYDEAERLLNQIKTLLTDPPDALQASNLYLYYTLLHFTREQVDEAAAAVQQSLAFSTLPAPGEAPDPDAKTRALQVRIRARVLSAAGRVAERQGEHAAADRWFQQALEQVSQTEYAETWHDITLTYADSLSTRGEHQRAAEHYRAAANARSYRPI